MSTLGGAIEWLMITVINKKRVLLCGKYAAQRLAIKHRKSREKELLIFNSPVNDDSEEDIVDRLGDKNFYIAGIVCSDTLVEELLSPFIEK
ncbi:hypothetical protein L1766_12330 [Thermovorax subterraneus]|nr:hypothetical protein [Thermovorax subterraneus]